MNVVLSVIAVAVLLVLLALSVRRQREIQAEEKRAVALAHTGADDQHIESLRRRDAVRAAHVARTEGTAAETPRVGSGKTE
jgi:hypothetical protein